MSSDELIDVAVRVLSAIDRLRPPDEDDYQVLKSQAEPEEMALSMEQLAGEIIKREIGKRRSMRPDKSNT